ncbi:MutS domain III family protein [Tritrichomonas foetus]|uniref:MutS domain III family protein n=1 Tax=Tritrichomonas foetus TaxID=1144522 RepID=A0A1J4JDL5_9EUKA|nr:MutS domain III family protein [Tritrichomonas foetus]|eukprot:OHS97192.1 MutS domain III family protein [Tritrichomonas foetus]
MEVGETPNFKICAFSWKKDDMGVVYYNSTSGEMSFSTYHPSQFPIIFEKIIQTYKVTHFVIPPCIKEEYSSYIEQQNFEGEKIELSTSDFSFKNGLNALNSITFLDSAEQQDYIKQSIVSGIIDVSSKTVVGAIGAIYNFLNTVNDDSDSSNKSLIISTFKTLEISLGLFLPKRSLEELQILSYDLHPSIHSNTTHSKDGLSLYSLFNRCSTVMGRKVLRKWFLVTLDSLTKINSRLDVIQEFISEKMHPYINEVISKLHLLPEIRPLLLRLQKESMNQQHWIRLNKGLKQAAELCHLIDSFSFLKENVNFANLSSENEQKLYHIVNSIESTIDLKPGTETHVKDGCDQQLTEMKKSYSNLDLVLTEVARKLMASLSSSCNISALSVVYVPQQGFLTNVLKSPSLSQDDVPDNYIFQFETDTHYYYKNESMKELDEELGDIYQNIIAREIRIIVGLSDKILSFSSLIFQIWETIGVLDAFCALSVVAVESKFVRPILTENEHDLIIVNGRHPLLEKFTNHLVPNPTLNLHNESQIHIITGPNSSGKSVYLKQIALIVYLAHIGSFVPADKAIIPFSDYLFGFFQTSNRDDDLFSSLFLNETKKVSDALKRCTKNSILMLDEFGKSSNNFDGASLLGGMIKYLHQKGVDQCPKTFISTHFHAILKPPFLEPFEMFIPCSMNVKLLNNINTSSNETKTNSDSDSDFNSRKECLDLGSVLFLYQLVKKDRSENNSYDNLSFGLHCARKAGLSEEIVSRAEEVAFCIEKSQTITTCKNCIDSLFEDKVKKALEIFFKWDSKKSSPRDLLEKIEDIIHGNI